MSVTRAEFKKLNGSLSWLVILTLPMLGVLSGSIGALTATSAPIEGWDTLWIRSIGFYGMTILPIGVAILASLAWKADHTVGNWNALMAQPVQKRRIVAAKAAVIACSSALMQLVLFLAVIVVGKLGLGIDAMLPTRYWVSSFLVALACIPVSLIQSLFSMLTKSFAIPVAIALVAAGLSTTALMLDLPGALLSPYALATYSTQLGTSLVGDASTAFNAAAITAVTITQIAVLVACLSAVFLWLSARILNRFDLHA